MLFTPNSTKSRRIRERAKDGMEATTRFSCRNNDGWTRTVLKMMELPRRDALLFLIVLMQPLVLMKPTTVVHGASFVEFSSARTLPPTNVKLHRDKATILIQPSTVSIPLVPSRSLSLRMGGYYSEPKYESDHEESNDGASHMMFGVRCRESVVAVTPEQYFTILEPIRSDAHLEYGTKQNEVAMARLILSHQEELPENIAVLEEAPEVDSHSSGLISVVLANLPGKRVTSYSSDSTQLQILKATHLFYNDGDPNALATVHLSDNDTRQLVSTSNNFRSEMLFSLLETRSNFAGLKESTHFWINSLLEHHPHLQDSGAIMTVDQCLDSTHGADVANQREVPNFPGPTSSKSYLDMLEQHTRDNSNESSHGM